ncbi:toll/interleukin-1 receptor domain-containing protein [Actinoplanes sp. NPDC049681]|uniref:toll/interleukin-1 receptor domain-containing protein n=1 Tax=Actinoplanes sp. NPDC049681 TaxID=3363905 RepID=UPI003797FB0C
MVNASGSRSPQKLFLSYAGPDRDYATWVGHTLQAAGYQVEMDADWATGSNFVLRMSDALDGPGRVVCLFSKAYFDRRRFTTDEWTAVLADRRRAGRLVPLLLERVTVPAVLRPLIYKDMVGLGESDARAALLEAVGGRAARTAPPPFPAR